jgi:hypothetical protein
MEHEATVVLDKDYLKKPRNSTAKDADRSPLPLSEDAAKRKRDHEPADGRGEAKSRGEAGSRPEARSDPQPRQDPLAKPGWFHRG